MRIWPYISFFFLFSCLSVQQAVILGKPVSFKVVSCLDTRYGAEDIYTAEVMRNAGEYELHVRRGPLTEVYYLPSNKLTILYQMEAGFKDIKGSYSHSYHHVTVTANKSVRKYKINTDLIANFITGLKKK